MLAACTLCPRNCRVDRLADQRGFCRIGRLAEIAGYGPHFGEESVLVGTGGSGTIFFCGCNLLCRFCQNYQISQATDVDCRPVTADELAAIMVELQEKGCHNINFVTPTHVVPQILAALPKAIEAGLHIPLIYNCGGYEDVESLRLLDGIIDIYMPDVKFSDRASASQYADVADYPEIMRAALGEMQRQVGDLRIGDDGLAEGGLLVRHLLMPGGLQEAEAIFSFLAKEISPNCYVNIMDQYRPCGEFAGQGGAATIGAEMYGQAIKAAQAAGLSRLDRKDFGALIDRLFFP
jgi:putative pyruvate formate lyase activating enzyme